METIDEIPWSEIVKTLRRAGMSPAKIAMQTGFSVKEIFDMQNGSWEPYWVPILKLLDLHHDLINGETDVKTTSSN